MISKLRRKFISITASALFLMLLLIMTAINCIFFFQTRSTLDTRLTFFMEEHPPGNKPPQDRNPQASEGLPVQPAPKDGTHDHTGFIPRFGEKLRIPSDGCLIVLTMDGTPDKIYQDAAEKYDEEEIIQMAEHIFLSGKEKGWHQYFRFRREEILSPNGTVRIKIGLLNASSDLYSVMIVLLISAVIGLFSYLLALLFIIFVSGKAVKPIAESYARQKQFITDAGHELKTPLTVISANNELARILYGDSEWFDSTDSQVSKMNSLVRSLITLARMDEGEKPVFSSFNLSDAVYDTAKSFENLSRSKGKKLILEITDDIMCYGDESGLRQTVSILTDNAVKYCDEGGRIVLKLQAEKSVRLQVINDFANVTELDLNQLFQRFYRADKARTSDGSYGLGLSIARSVIEQHKGTIQAKALPGGKILFEVLLPRKQ